MLRQLVNWRTGLALVAIFIASGTIIYSRYLASKIEKEERQKVELWVKAGQKMLTSGANADVELASYILTANNTIPIIYTNENDSIYEYSNLDSAKAAKPEYVEKKLRQFKSQHLPLEWKDPVDSTKVNRYYYGESKLLKEVRYYPLVQLGIVALFILITLFSIRSSYRSVQNQLWTGMAKETAHQLGTPVSSLEGWVEMLRSTPGSEKIAQELEKDVNRLRLVSDRFGKIGSTPQLETINLVTQINSMVDYMRRRAAGRIVLKVNSNKPDIITNVSPPLFDWVIENLLKNALDAMEGKGSITVDINDEDKRVVMDITDTGKGISKKNISMVFKPGFTTKRRGWGLGLSLSKRIIEQFHKGEIFVKNSEIGKGTTFRIILKK
jgi:signal transduction histidine kinase